MEFRLLGPLEVAEDGRLVALGGSRVRALLALLLLRRNEVVTIDRIVDELWAERPPKTAEQVVRVYVSQLRKALEPTRSDGPPQVLVTQGSGYVLRVDSGQVDVDRFAALQEEGRRLLAAGNAAQAAGALEEALSLWRGRSLQEFADERFAQPEIARLEALRLTTLEDLFDSKLAAGRDSELVADLEQLVEANPLRERLRAQLMLALYRSGRQADALGIYQRGRRLLVDDLGLEPSESLRLLEARILQQDPALDRPSVPTGPAEPPEAPPARSRRLAVPIAVTVLGIVAIAGLVTAVTAGHGGGRESATPSRVALVFNLPRNLAETSPQLGPIDGLRAAAKELDVETTVRYGGYGQTDFLRALGAAARTSGLVIVGATPSVDAVSRLTRRFPKTRFLVPDSVFDHAASFGGQANVTGVKFDDREDGFLGGYLAGLMTHGDQAVSAVGGLPTEAVRDLIAGFEAGARRARPGVRMLVDYAQSFVKQAPCEQAANRQIDRGSAVVFDVAGDCGFGALQAAGIRGVWGLGVDSDLSYLGPQIVASVVKRFDRATQLAVTLFTSGRLPGGQDLRLDLSSNSIGLIGISNRVPRGVRAKVEAVAAKLRARDQARDARSAATAPSSLR
jgi:DNA-binding SARP family transcriptional activator/basic membrane lipoprotein Med (substrate-binding protein (PBP1-ABC) superfamily)